MAVRAADLGVDGRIAPPMENDHDHRQRRPSGAGDPSVPSPPHGTFVRPALSYDPVTNVMFGSLASISLAPFGMALAFLPPLRELNSEIECGEDGEIRVSSSNMGDGTSYGLYCSNDHDALLIGHYASALSIYFALILEPRPSSDSSAGQGRSQLRPSHERPSPHRAHVFERLRGCSKGGKRKPATTPHHG